MLEYVLLGEVQGMITVAGTYDESMNDPDSPVRANLTKHMCDVVSVLVQRVK